MTQGLPRTDPARLRKQGLTIAAVIVVLDQVTKWWILTQVMNPPKVIELAPFANLVLVWNRGVSFGLFNTGSPFTPWILSGLATAVSVFLLIWMVRQADPWVTRGIGLIVGGAVGNIIDRLIHGAVLDFIDLHAAGHHWPAFNVADSAITVGAAVLILDTLFQRDKSS
ncbi:MAG: signal peptidase II [Rhodospirillaceae bacterium]